MASQAIEATEAEGRIGSTSLSSKKSPKQYELPAGLECRVSEAHGRGVYATERLKAGAYISLKHEPD